MATLDLRALPLDTVEEAAGELHRRLGVALRRLGEARADQPAGGPGTPTARWEVAELACAFEQGAVTLAAALEARAAPAGDPRSPALVAALLYGAPTLPALLARLEADRRMLWALARRLGPAIDAPLSTAWGERTPRALLVELAIEGCARRAQTLEAAAARAAADDAASEPDETEVVR